MSVNIPQDAYPLATQDNRAIPLDIVRPMEFVYIPIGSSIPRQASQRLLYCEALGGPALLSFQSTPEAPVPLEPSSQLCYIPHGLVMAIALPEGVMYIGCSAFDVNTTGLAIQFIENWQALGPPISYARRL